MRTEMAIPKQVTQGVELIVVRRIEYERLQRHLAEVEDALSKIRRGEHEYRTGKTRIVHSLGELRRT